MGVGRKSVLPIGVAGVVLAVTVFAVGLPFAFHGRRVAPKGRVSFAASSALPRSAASWSKSAAPPSAPATPSTTGAEAAASSASGAPAAPFVAPDPAAFAPSGPSIDAYRGLASWVDVYDDQAWGNPKAAIADMAKHGVRTLFIETGNSNSPYVVKRPAQLRIFIREAHAHDMRIVAWYLPGMQSVAFDYYRIAQAIKFTTPDGQKFDSFALDIESNVIGSESARNLALTSLSSRIRGLVGHTYPLGAIIPAPVGLNKKRGYWNAFPYTMIAEKYDVILPMGYYTYHGNGAALAYADSAANISILRAKKGCSTVPIHLIGGESENSSQAEVRAFVRAQSRAQCIGASLYSWPGTSAGAWRELAAVGR